ncbi:major facilitator family transporter [Obelidium mucronatum]|nr:major facilitator family transporter [Obelidium mucronatum]
MNPSDDITPAALRKIMLAACAGTLIEWYDFIIFGSLSATTASQFYKTGTQSGDLIAWLAAFAIGFIVRPLGSIVFGFVGDKFGRKSTFTVSLVMMGVATFLCGCLPTYNDVGVTAGVLLIILRILQGLAVGGEYGGAVSYIAEHVPQKQRGFYLSFLQAMSTSAMVVSLSVILMFRLTLGDADWTRFGWRFPFLISIFLVGISIYIRYSMQESPMYTKAKEEGKMVNNPLVESIGRPYNLYYVLVVLFGCVMGQTGVVYCAQFYTLTFIQATLKVPFVTSNTIVLLACLFAIPAFIIFGHFSDKIGRKKVMVTGMVLSTALFYPLYMALYQFRPFENNKNSEPFRDQYSPVMIGFLVWIMVTLSIVSCAPTGAFLSELFPTSIRYTSISIPYHIGAGVFGGLTPLVATAIATATGDRLSGLFYPIILGGVSSLIAIVLLPETVGRDIQALGLNGKIEENGSTNEKATKSENITTLD